MLCGQAGDRELSLGHNDDVSSFAPSDERGASVSAFFAMVFPALLLICGLAIDGAAHANALRTAEVVAAQVARAGVDAAAPAQLSGGSGEAQALRAARDSLTSHPNVSGTVSLDAAGRLQVVTETQAETTFLRLLGIETLRAEGQATAQLDR